MTPNTITWRPSYHLPGAEIRIADVHRPLTAGDSWRATLGAHIYLLAGTETAEQRVSGYIGLSHSLNSGRPWVSLTKWARNQRALSVDTIALVRFTHEPDLDALKIIEARIIRGTTSASIYTYNTNSSAPGATKALGAAGNRVAAFGDFVERVLRFHAYGGRRNSLLTPASTLHESAIRVVLAAKTGIDTDDVLERLNRIGVLYNSNTSGASARRDLTIREVSTAGAPRVLTTHVGRKAVYYPRGMSESLAVARYVAGLSKPYAA